MEKQHLYAISVEWTGNLGKGTIDYLSYLRDHLISSDRKIAIQGSSDSAFRGDGSKYNPEELLVASLSACHMLWYLHLCADSGIVVTKYSDKAIGTMIMMPNGGGFFSNVILSPIITITDAEKISLAHSLHGEANKRCFIANSCRFSVHHNPEINVARK